MEWEGWGVDKGSRSRDERRFLWVQTVLKSGPLTGASVRFFPGHKHRSELNVKLPPPPLCHQQCVAVLYLYPPGICLPTPGLGSAMCEPWPPASPYVTVRLGLTPSRRLHALSI
jgi:hypothetical protein